MAAWFKTERAVLIQMGPRYAADDSKDWEVVAYDDDGFIFLVTAGDSV